MNLLKRNQFRPSVEGLETRTTPALLGITATLPGFVGPLAPVAAPAVSASPLAATASINDKVLSFARDSINKTVRLDKGGDCYDFVSEALRKAGARTDTHTGARTINGEVHHVWGSTVYQKSMMGGWNNTGSLASIRPGDAIQFDGCKFVNGGSSQKTSHHSAIVESVDVRTGTIKVIHQNVNGVKKVVRGQFNVNHMTTGVMTVYRPQRR